MSFVGLHVHSYYSLMDGLSSPLELCQRARELGQPALAITDHGTLSAHREFQKAAEETGVKPILGLEAYISPTDRFDRRSVTAREDNTQLYNHIILLAKTQRGYENLHHLSREAWESGFYYKPRIDMDLLFEHGDDIVVLSGCLNGLIAKAIERGEYDEAVDISRRLHDRFGSDFYMELQPHNPDDINNALHTIASDLGIREVVTTDCHFSHPDERAAEEALLILSTSPKWDKDQDYKSTKDIEDIFERYDTLYPERPISFADLDVYMMGRDDVIKRMEKYDWFSEDMLDATLDIADQIGKYKYYSELDLLPSEYDNPQKELTSLVYEGLRNKGIDTAEYRKRADKELGIIESKNFAPYFLIVADAVNWAKDNDILVGMARGSAASSLVCYATGITKVDPIEHNLLFARFINEERNDYPDIDIDIEDKRRHEVKEYLRDKYNHVGNITNFIYFKDKGVIRDAARVFRVPLDDVNRVLKGVEAFEDFMNSQSTLWFREKYPEVHKLAGKLRNRIKSVGMHAGGVVISKEPIENYAPIETRDDPSDKVSGRVPVVAWDMEQCEGIGLIKFDFLGLNTLSVIHTTLDLIGEPLDFLDEIPLDDARVYEELDKARTVGIFQADASPYRNILRDMRINGFDDLVASNALVRPGAKDTVGESFIARQHGNEDITYIHDDLIPYTEDTYGTIIYQEQVMIAAVVLGGFTWSEADHLRKIIGKKQDVRKFDKYRDKFIENASEKIGGPQAEQLWQSFEAHAGYSFNKAHSVGYSYTTYQSAWLKINYPLEYMTASLMHEDDSDKRMEFLIETKRLGIPVRLPHVNKSEDTYSIENGSVRIGLKDIKYVGDKVYAKLNKHRPFNSYEELVSVAKQKYSGISSRTLDALNAVGAAAFKDNPRTGEEEDNYYEYLNIPKFDFYELPDRVYELIDNVEDFTKDGAFVFKALAKGVKKRGKGWTLWEIVDETGKVGVFHDAESDIEPGQLYIMLVGNNRIMRYVTVSEVSNALAEGSEDPLVVYLLSREIKNASGPRVYILRVEKFFTKSRKLMANLVCCNSDKELRSLVVFPRQFSQLYGKLEEGTVKELSVKQLDDGGYMLLDVQGD